MAFSSKYLQSILPQGGSLSQADWSIRHRGILRILWCHAIGVPLFGLSVGVDSQVCWESGALLALIAGVAGIPVIHRRAQSAITTLGLMAASALLVHLSGGIIEIHFHFFVMMAVIVLYQDWVPFLLGLLFIVIDHGLVGTLMPTLVYNHHAAQSRPWTWAVIHGTFILAESAALLYFWRMSEIAQLKVLESEMRTRMTIETALDAIVTTDSSGTIIEWNARAETMFNLSREEAIGQPLSNYLSADSSRNRLRACTFNRPCFPARF